jgi:hypothetical protein
LSPALRRAQRFDSLRQQPQELGFGYWQPPSFRNGSLAVVRSELQSGAPVSAWVAPDPRHEYPTHSLQAPDWHAVIAQHPFGRHPRRRRRSS